MAILEVVVDHAQQRIAHDRQATTLDGTSWRTDFNRRFQQRTWVDTATRTAILVPNVMEPEFDTTFTGRFRRFRKTDYTLVSPSSWVESEGGRGSGDYWLESKGVVDENVVTASTWKANQGFYISWFAFNANISKQAMIECGWCRNSDGTGGIVTFRFLSGGYVDVFFNDHFEKTYTLSRVKTNDDGNERGSQQQQEFTDVMLMPWRNREVMILPAGGEPVVHVLEGLSEQHDQPIIPDGSYFFWRVRDTQAKVQLVPVLFKVPDAPTDGAPGSGEAFVCAQPTTFLEVPVSGQELESRAVFYPSGDYVQARLRNADNTANHAADGSLSSVDAVIRVDFLVTPVGGETTVWGGETTWHRTPYVYGAQCSYKALTASTEGADLDLLPYLRSVRLKVEKDQPQATLSLVVENPDQFESDHPFFSTLDFRPIQVRLGSNVLFEGVLGDMRYDDSPVALGRTLSITAKDAWHFFETYMLSDVFPLDGLALEDAVRDLAGLAGLDLEYDIPATGFTIPAPGLDSGGNFHAIVDVGETIADGLNRVKEAHAGNFLMGFRPGEKYTFFFADPSEMDATPRFDLYTKVEDAKAAFLTDYAKHIVYSYRAEPAPALVTEIWLQGFDPHTGKPLLAHVASSEEIDDPEVPVTNRTATWSGYPRKYSFSAKELNSVALLKRAAKLLALRLMRRRVYVEFNCQFMEIEGERPVWVGDVVHIHGVGKVRVLALDGEFVRERNEFHEFEWRPFTYAGELIEQEGE